MLFRAFREHLSQDSLANNAFQNPFVGCVVGSGPCTQFPHFGSVKNNLAMFWWPFSVTKRSIIFIDLVTCGGFVTPAISKPHIFTPNKSAGWKPQAFRNTFLYSDIESEQNSCGNGRRGAPLLWPYALITFMPFCHVNIWKKYNCISRQRGKSFRSKVNPYRGVSKEA